MTKVFILNHENDSHWALVPQVMHRIENFNNQFTPASNPAWFKKLLRHHFVVDWGIKEMVAVVCVNDEGVVVGHAIATIEKPNGSAPYLNVGEYHLDRGSNILEEELMGGMEDLYAWARSMGCKEFHVLARNGAVARLAASRYGFNTDAVLMHKPIPEPVKGE
jgi:hypothetical protein